jgi:putative transposase
MKQKRFTEEQIAYALRHAESGTPVAEVCRKLGISEQTFYRWKKKQLGMGVGELRRLMRGTRDQGNTRIHRRSQNVDPGRSSRHPS